MIQNLINSIIDGTSASLCGYVVFVGIGRMALMSWKTHKRVWILIYFALVLSCILYLYYMAVGAPHGQLGPLSIYIATALWFHESRDRWELRAPPHMLRARTAEERTRAPEQRTGVERREVAR